MKPIYDRAQIRQLRAQGLKYKEIAEIVGCHFQTIWSALNPEKYRAGQQRCHDRRKNDPAYLEMCRANTRKTMRKKMGIVNPTAEMRSGPCEICGRFQPKLVLDHDHLTGLARGWLCRSCNRGLGYLQDSPSVLDAALKYLAK